MNHIEKKANLYYATLTVPVDMRGVMGRRKFVQTLMTDNKAKAIGRAAVLVEGWKKEITKARNGGGGIQPLDPFWESLRSQYGTADAGTQSAIEEVAEKLGSTAYRSITNKLTPLVAAWKQAQKGNTKTTDQMSRDLHKMADHFHNVEALQPNQIKAWTDKLLVGGATYATFIRLGCACRSFWAYLQNSSTIKMGSPDPFVGALTLALKAAVRTDTGRSGTSYTVEQLTGIYSAAVAKNDQGLADLIALGAYTGCRIEELGRLTKETCTGGAFTIEKSKTNAGIRQCPIHPAVAPLVARMLSASTDGYLVPSSADNQYGFRTSPLSKKFGRLKTSLGFGTGHTFHSTRSTLITLMDRAGVPEGIAADVVGHDKKTITYGLYSSGSSLTQKLEAISKVAYPGALGNP